MNKIIWVIVIIVLILAGYLIWGNKDVEVPAPAEIDDMAAAPGVIETPAPEPSVKEFSVSGSNFKFSVPEMRVKQGELVRVVFKSESGMHDWKLDEFNAATKMLAAGQTETVEFVADKVGTFEYYCSIGQHRQAGMVGKLIVE